jgi:hypothetical protein
MMSLRRITKSFSAMRLDPKVGATCSQLEGCNISGNATISPNDRLLNDGFPEQDQIVNGVEVVQFELGDVPYCAERSVYDDSTEIIEKPLL